MEFIDHEDWFKKRPTLKTVFDNLRNYPLLAVLFSGTALVYQRPFVAAKVIAVALAVVFGALTIASLLQTVHITMSLLVHTAFGAKLPEKKIMLIPAVALVVGLGTLTFFGVGFLSMGLISAVEMKK